MRFGLAVVLLLTLPACAMAGSYTVKADDAALKAVADDAKLTPQQVVQRVVDSFLKSRAHAAMNRKLGDIQRRCQAGDTKACAAIDAVTKDLGK